MNDLIAACDEVLRCWTHGDAAAMPHAMMALQEARKAVIQPIVGEDIRSTEVIAQRERTQ